MTRKDVFGAKKKFFEDYSKKISDLGYSLNVGLGWEFPESTNFDALEVRVQSSSDIPKDSRNWIASIIPKKYFYDGSEIAVKLYYARYSKIL